MTHRDMKTEKPATLTKGEMQVMNILWEHPEGLSVHDILNGYAEPRPAYTTVSTFLKILCCKEFVTARKGQGKQLIFAPAVSRAAYTRRVMQEVKDNFFGGSASSLLRFFVREERLSEAEIQALIETVESSWEV